VAASLFPPGPAGGPGGGGGGGGRWRGGHGPKVGGARGYARQWACTCPACARPHRACLHGVGIAVRVLLPARGRLRRLPAGRAAAVPGAAAAAAACCMGCLAALITAAVAAAAAGSGGAASAGAGGHGQVVAHKVDHRPKHAVAGGRLPQLIVLPSDGALGVVYDLQPPPDVGALVWVLRRCLCRGRWQPAGFQLQAC